MRHGRAMDCFGRAEHNNHSDAVRPAPGRSARLGQGCQPEQQAKTEVHLERVPDAHLRSQETDWLLLTPAELANQGWERRKLQGTREEMLRARGDDLCLGRARILRHGGERRGRRKITASRRFKFRSVHHRLVDATLPRSPAVLSAADHEPPGRLKPSGTNGTGKPHADPRAELAAAEGRV